MVKRQPSLLVAAETLRNVILESKGSTKDVILAVHRLNQVFSKASTFAQAERVMLCLLVAKEGSDTAGKAEEGKASTALLEILVDVVVKGRPETYPVLCLLYTFSLFEVSCAQLRKLHVHFILQAMLKGQIEDVVGELAKKILNTMDKQTQKGGS